MVLPDKWGNYPAFPSTTLHTGKCKCGHDISKHASRIGTCMAGTCSCQHFEEEPYTTPKTAPIPTPIAVKKRHHSRRDHASMTEYYACQICQANREK